MIHEFIEFFITVLPVALIATLLIHILNTIIWKKKRVKVIAIYRRYIKNKQQKQFNTLEHHLTE